MNLDKKYIYFTVGAIGTFSATLEGSIINVALPTISNELNCSVSQIAWVALVYSLTLISLMLILGVWADKKGYYFAYRFGYVFFLLGTVLCTLSQTYYFLLFGRIIQATGTAMFAAIGPGLVTTVFPKKERGMGIGLMVMMVSAGFMVGPPLGGLLLTYFPWQSVFAVNIPVGLIGLLMATIFLKDLDKTKKEDKQIKFKSALSISTSLVTFTFFLTMLKDHTYTDINLWLVGMVSIIAMSMFLKYESSPDTAMIGLDIFKNSQFTTSVTAMMFMFISLSGVLIIVPFYLEQVMNFTPQKVGYFLIILPVMMFIFAPLSGKLSDKIGYRFLTVSGILILIAGLFLLSNISQSSGIIYIVSCLSVIGMGVGVFNTPNSSALMGSVSDDFRAITSSILGTTRNIGISMGVAISITMFTYFQNRNAYLENPTDIFISSYRIVIYISIAIAAISLISSLFRTSDSKNKR